MSSAPRHDWTVAEIEALFALPFLDLLLDAQRTHRLHFAPNRITFLTPTNGAIVPRPLVRVNGWWATLTGE